MNPLKKSRGTCMSCGGMKKANLSRTLSTLRRGEYGMEMDDMPRVKAIDPLNLAAQTTLNKLENPTLSPERQKVKSYQEMLRSKGYDIAADGAWGPKTQNAYEKYIKTKSATPSMTNMGSKLEAIHGSQKNPVRMQEITIKAKKPMGTAANLKQIPNTRMMEPASVTNAFNNLSKYKQNSPKMSPYKGVSANEKLVLDRLAKYKAGKLLR